MRGAANADIIIVCFFFPRPFSMGRLNTSRPHPSNRIKLPLSLSISFATFYLSSPVSAGIGDSYSLPFGEGGVTSPSEDWSPDGLGLLDDVEWSDAMPLRVPHPRNTCPAAVYWSVHSLRYHRVEHLSDAVHFH